MTARRQQQPSVCHYFVDEAGDPTLFSRRGRIIAGEEGCSRFFMLGLLEVECPESLQADLEALRVALLQDPYFKDVPSMQPETRKTATAFHAKDDLPEVRREVFAVLRRHQLRFFAVVRDKRRLADSVLQWNQQSDTYRYRPNDLYDQMVSRLFKDRLHKASELVIQFARRGASDRTGALRAAIDKARRRFEKKWSIASDPAIQVLPRTPAQSAGLQAADYLLWALQRFYERGEQRFLDLIWLAFRLVHDVDDTRTAKYGCYYNQKTPLTQEALKGRLPGI